MLLTLVMRWTMLFFLVIGCAGLVAEVSCHPRPNSAGAGAADLNNYVEQPLDKKVKYHYAYGIDDAPSGVFSHKWEERLGNYVKGAYSMMQPDGMIRTVDYEVDGPKGFHAIVRTTSPGNSFLSYQQLRKSRDSNPNPPVNVLTNNIPTRPVLEPRTPRLIHKDLPPNFHSVKPEYFWGSAPGGHAAQHQHSQNGGQRGRHNPTQGAGTHSSYRTPALDSNNGRGLHGSNGKGRDAVEHGQDRSTKLRNSNGQDVYKTNGNVQFEGGDSVGRGQSSRSRLSSYQNVQNYNQNSQVRAENSENVVSSRRSKGRRQESEGGNYLGGGVDDLSGVMLPPRRNAEVMNYDHLLRAGKITDALFL